MAEPLYRNGPAYVVEDTRHPGRYRVIWTDSVGRQREKTGGRDLTAARKVADSIARQDRTLDQSERAVWELVEAYLQSKPHLEDSSIARDTSYMRQHISVVIGDIVCRDLEAVKVAEAFGELADYARETRLSVAALYRALGRFGVQQGAWTSDRDPFKTIKVGRAQKGERVASKLLNPSDIPARELVWDLLSVMADQGHDLWADAGHVIDVTGVRWQEVAALEVEHVDLDGLTIFIRQAISRDRSGNPVLGPPKSDAGVRDIPITASLAERLAPRIAAVGDGLIFAGPRGGLPRSSNVSRDFLQPARAASSYPNHCAWHSIRHTTITRWVRAGDIAAASELAGHETISYTLDKYVGRDSTHHVEAARRIVT